MTRALRNNNPGNLIITDNPWIGKKAVNSDGFFEQFISLSYGCQALLITLENSIRVYGHNSIKKIIKPFIGDIKYTNSYLKAINHITDLYSNQVIKENDSIMICNIAYAICCLENGITKTEKEGITKERLIYEWTQIKK